MSNARLAGGLVALGIGLVTIGIGQSSTQSHAMVVPPGGEYHNPWAWSDQEYFYYAQLETDASPSQLIRARFDTGEMTGQTGFFASATQGGTFTEFQVAVGSVSITGGDFTFPAGSTILGGDPETV